MENRNIWTVESKSSWILTGLVWSLFQTIGISAGMAVESLDEFSELSLQNLAVESPEALSASPSANKQSALHSAFEQTWPDLSSRPDRAATSDFLADGFELFHHLSSGSFSDSIQAENIGRFSHFAAEFSNQQDISDLGFLLAQSRPDILVPDPEILIEGGAPGLSPGVPTVLPAPPLLPRAAAPPVGDIAVSNINTAPDVIDLGTSVRIPRLVLRDAPVREVLSLLAQAAGLNLVFTAGQGDQAEEAQSNISLDLANEPVQEVFNSVLLVSGFSASRRGNTIFVGPRLPDMARNLISRTLRLNQVGTEAAATFLASQGAEVTQVIIPISEITDPETQRVVRREEQAPEIRTLTVDAGDDSLAPLLLSGLKVTTDDRLNSITLIGEPRKVEMANAFLTQLDARRRQVAVNVKIVDVILSNEQDFSSSFSFGVNDTFFVQDDGAATLRFGQTGPAGTTDINSATGRLSNPPIITTPGAFTGAEIFLDTSDPITVDNLGNTNLVQIDNRPGAANPLQIFPIPTSVFPGARVGVTDNPLVTGITELTFPENTEITISEDGTVTFTEGSAGEATVSAPSLFQFSKNFLAQIEAQIVSGNAKILTDPTLVVQEGQQATVRLVQDVVTSVDTSVDALSGVRTITPVIGEAGVVLTVSVDRIDDNGFVSLSVAPTVSSLGPSQEFESGDGASNAIVLLQRRELSSGLVRLRDGQTLILSGIIQESDQTTISKVPVLGDIPLLGALFRSTNTDTDRSEVIILLTPQIVDERSNFGYNYVPGSTTREELRQRGFSIPGNPY